MVQLGELFLAVAFGVKFGNSPFTVEVYDQEVEIDGSIVTTKVMEVKAPDGTIVEHPEFIKNKPIVVKKVKKRSKEKLIVDSKQDSADSNKSDKQEEKTPVLEAGKPTENNVDKQGAAEKNVDNTQQQKEQEGPIIIVKEEIIHANNVDVPVTVVIIEEAEEEEGEPVVLVEEIIVGEQRGSESERQETTHSQETVHTPETAHAEGATDTQETGAHVPKTTHVQEDAYVPETHAVQEDATYTQETSLPKGMIHNLVQGIKYAQEERDKDMLEETSKPTEEQSLS